MRARDFENNRRPCRNEQQISQLRRFDGSHRDRVRMRGNSRPQICIPARRNSPNVPPIRESTWPILCEEKKKSRKLNMTWKFTYKTKLTAKGWKDDETSRQCVWRDCYQSSPVINWQSSNKRNRRTLDADWEMQVTRTSGKSWTPFGDS